MGDPTGDAMRFETAAVHAGQDPEPVYGAVNVPIYQNATYLQEEVGTPKVWDYARGGNPTRAAFEAALAALEGGEHCFAFASGMAAETTLLLTLRPGDHVLLADDVYGGTYRLLSKVLGPWGLAFDTCDLTDLGSVREAVRAETRFVWVETPSNPTLKIVDIAAVSSAAHAGGAKVVVDNTFATPAAQRPLALGADVVVHSVTKYIGGHSDLIGGALVTRDTELVEPLGFLVNAVGAVPGPMDCFLVLRGIKTLPVRMDRHYENALAILELLVEHPKIEKIFYPFQDAHPQRKIALQQMKNGGGMISFIMKGGRAAAITVAEATKIFTLAESLGGVESLIEVPAVMTHLSVAGSQLDVDPGLVRLSVGIENKDDLLEDIKQALEKA